MIIGKLASYKQAIRDLDRAIELNPPDVEAYNNRGVLYWGLGNHRQAFGDLKIAAKLGYGKAQEFLKARGMEW